MKEHEHPYWKETIDLAKRREKAGYELPGHADKMKKYMADTHKKDETIVEYHERLGTYDRDDLADYNKKMRTMEDNAKLTAKGKKEPK